MKYFIFLIMVGTSGTLVFSGTGLPAGTHQNLIKKCCVPMSTGDEKKFFEYRRVPGSGQKIFLGTDGY